MCTGSSMARSHDLAACSPTRFIWPLVWWQTPLNFQWNEKASVIKKTHFILKGIPNWYGPATNAEIPSARAGVLVLSTRTRSTRVLNFWYSYFTRTREFQIDSIRTCTRTHGQVLRYSYEYWHEYWYSMVHLWCKGENHHTCEIDSLTYHKRKVPNLFILLLKYDLNIWYMGCDSKFHRKINWITIMMFMFIVVIRASPFSHSTSG